MCSVAAVWSGRRCSSRAASLHPFERPSGRAEQATHPPAAHRPAPMTTFLYARAPPRAARRARGRWRPPPGRSKCPRPAHSRRGVHSEPRLTKPPSSTTACHAGLPTSMPDTDADREQHTHSHTHTQHSGAHACGSHSQSAGMASRRLSESAGGSRPGAGSRRSMAAVDMRCCHRSPRLAWRRPVSAAAATALGAASRGRAAAVRRSSIGQRGPLEGAHPCRPWRRQLFHRACGCAGRTSTWIRPGAARRGCPQQRGWLQLRARPWPTWLQAGAAEPVSRRSARPFPDLEPATANASRPAAGAGSTSAAAAAPAAAAAAGAADPRGAAGSAEPDPESLERSLTSGSGGGGSRSGVSRGGSRSGGGSAGRGGGRDGGAGGGRGARWQPVHADSRRGQGSVSPASSASRGGGDGGGGGGSSDEAGGGSAVHHRHAAIKRGSRAGLIGDESSSVGAGTAAGTAAAAAMDSVLGHRGRVLDGPLGLAALASAAPWAAAYGPMDP